MHFMLLAVLAAAAVANAGLLAGGPVNAHGLDARTGPECSAAETVTITATVTVCETGGHPAHPPPVTSSYGIPPVGTTAVTVVPPPASSGVAVPPVPITTSTIGVSPPTSIGTDISTAPSVSESQGLTTDTTSPPPTPTHGETASHTSVNPSQSNPPTNAGSALGSHHLLVGIFAYGLLEVVGA